MQEYLKGPLSVHLRRAAIAVLVCGVVAAAVATIVVTGPVHLKGEGPVHLSTSGPFDFISPLGNQAELVRFRQDAPPARDYPVIDTLTEYELSRMFDVKRVRAKLNRGDTDTAFMISPN
jgi:hypothetical protein